MASGPITSWQIDGVGTMRHFIFLGSKITADGECSHEIKRHLLLRRKAMTNLDSIIKSRDRSRCHLHPEPSLGQSCHRQKKKKNLASMYSGSLLLCPILCDPLDWLASPLCWGWGGGSPGKNTGVYWPIGFHTLLKHYISCCPSRQLP